MDDAKAMSEPRKEVATFIDFDRVQVHNIGPVLPDRMVSAVAGLDPAFSRDRSAW
jgi:hypothetical protein